MSSEWTMETLKEMLDERYANQQAAALAARADFEARLTALSERTTAQGSELDKIDGATRQTARVLAIAITIVGILSLAVATYSALRP